MATRFPVFTGVGGPGNRVLIRRAMLGEIDFLKVFPTPRLEQVVGPRSVATITVFSRPRRPVIKSKVGAGVQLRES